LSTETIEKMEKQRQGTLVKPHCRLSEKDISKIDGVSRQLLEDPGLLCYNKNAAEIFKSAGAEVIQEENYARVKIPSKIIDRALASAPSKVVLGARNPDNRLILDADEPRVRFGSGSETNVWLDVSFDDKGNPSYDRQPGSIERLTKAAQLCDKLENLDFFIRCVNIQDEQVNAGNKDVNKFLASLNNITKHVQAGLTSIDALDDLVKLGHIITGGKDSFEKNPLISFITCVIKSPLQVVDDTAEKLIEISKRRLPVVISSCPMGGATGPFDEFGMVSLINAELLAGVTITQLVNPTTPVLYGAVPVRTRLDNLNDMYGAPEFVHYNIDCAQMARHYSLPCYSTAGVADTSTPGIQATVEKLMSYLTIPRAGAQYIHYAFGLLERTNVFCPAQAVMDDAHIGIAKRIMAEPDVDSKSPDELVQKVKTVMDSDHKTFIYDIPIPSREDVYVYYPLEDKERGALYAANEKYKSIISEKPDQLDDETKKKILEKVPNVLRAALD
jgi:trimethylamine--corrinoid protein Co-methyltransferase